MKTLVSTSLLNWLKICGFWTFLGFRWNIFVCCRKRLKKQSWISIWKVNSSVGIEMYNIHKRLTWRTNLLRTLSFHICRLRHSRLWSPFKFSAIILYILLMVLLILHILKKVPISSDEKLVDNNALGMYYVLYIYMY